MAAPCRTWVAVAYADFPWFKKATIEQLSDVQRPSEDHLHWPRLDVDLSVESIRKPVAFPLVSIDVVISPVK